MTTLFTMPRSLAYRSQTTRALCHTREIEDLVWGEIESVNQRFAQVETIKKFRLIDQLLDAEDEELTPTQKLKRTVVNTKYAELIDGMYASPA